MLAALARWRAGAWARGPALNAQSTQSQSALRRRERPRPAVATRLAEERDGVGGADVGFEAHRRADCAEQGAVGDDQDRWVVLERAVDGGDGAGAQAGEGFAALGRVAADDPV